jgi:hypothetical protein
MVSRGWAAVSGIVRILDEVKTIAYVYVNVNTAAVGGVNTARKP